MRSDARGTRCTGEAHDAKRRVRLPGYARLAVDREPDLDRILHREPVEPERRAEADDAVRDTRRRLGERLVLAESRASQDVESTPAPLEPSLGMGPAEDFSRDAVRGEVAGPEHSLPAGEGEHTSLCSLPRRRVATIRRHIMRYADEQSHTMWCSSSP